jgi:hypothetical protein
MEEKKCRDVVVVVVVVVMGGDACRWIRRREPCSLGVTKAWAASIGK